MSATRTRIARTIEFACALLLLPGLRFFLRLPAGKLSIGEVFPAVLARHVVDVIEHELVVGAAEPSREQAPELTELLRKHRLRRLFEILYEGRVRHGMQSRQALPIKSVEGR